MYIESPQNPRVRAWSQLKSKKGRQKQGLFLVEGRRLIEELLESTYEVESLLWDVSTDEPFESILSHKKAEKKLVELSPSAFAMVSDTTTPQGLIAVAKLPVNADIITAQIMQPYAVLLDGIQDPGNVGTLLRSAEAFNFTSVCCGTHTVDPFSPKVVRSTMGGMFRLQISVADSIPFIQAWREKFTDGQVVVAAAEATQFSYEADFTKPTLFIVGSEAVGASQSVRDEADLTVAIPMQADTESLNAGVAGSILLYESYRQRQTKM